MPAPDDPTRTRLLDAAGATFAEFGFEKATIRDICSRADVNLASVNYHFGDKQRLYRETILQAHERAVSEVPLPEWPDGTPPERRLGDFIHTMIHRMAAMQRLPWHAQLIMREFAQPTGACELIAHEYIKPHFEILVGIVSELVPAETPPHRKHQLAFSVIGQSLFYMKNDPVIHILIPESELEEHFQPSQLAEHITRVMLAAFGRRPLE